MRIMLVLAALGLSTLSANAQAALEPKPVPVPAPTQPVLESRNDWNNALVRNVQRSFRTPPEMRREGPWGQFNVRIHFEVTPEGEVRNVSVAESSGIIDVDVFAVSGITQAFRSRPLPPFTPDMGDQPIKYLLPITLENPEPKQIENSDVPKLEPGDPAG